VRRCKHCQSEMPPASKCVTFIGKQRLCSIECAAQWGQAEAIRREQVKRKREAKKALKEYKDNDHGYQFRKTREAAQRLANRLDKDLNCICCDRPRTSQFCGGHFKTAGGNSEIALDLRNIHGQQNQYCNMAKSANIEGDKHSFGYKEGIRRRYGNDLLEWLESYHPPLEFNTDDLRALRAIYAEETRRVERGEGPSRDWRSLDYTLRDLIIGD
jgi:hypothetical protein